MKCFYFLIAALAIHAQFVFADKDSKTVATADSEITCELNVVTAFDAQQKPWWNQSYPTGQAGIYVLKTVDPRSPGMVGSWPQKIGPFASVELAEAYVADCQE